MKRIVVIGSPGSGKTACLEIARRLSLRRVEVSPCAARIVLHGGFPRDASIGAGRALQRAIYHVTREVESLFDDRQSPGIVLCEGGTLDGLAYWPGEQAAFFRQLGTSRDTELGRYSLVLHLRTRAAEGEDPQGVRQRPSFEARRIDAALEEAWNGHPHRVFIDHTRDFVERVRQVLALLEREAIAVEGEASASLSR